MITYTNNTGKHDVFGRALHDYFRKGMADTLWLHNPYGEAEKMPVDVFFRGEDALSELEDIALALCDGEILDVGAGVGSNALVLQERGMAVTALEISAKACTIMQRRGVKQIVQADFFGYDDSTYDTLLFLMNGIGLAGTLAGLEQLLYHSQRLLKPGGQLLFDSSDISYLYADGLVERPASYFGEIRYQYQYQGKRGIPFNWLYIDQQTLIDIAQPLGWVVQILYEDEDDQYLARMELRS